MEVQRRMMSLETLKAQHPTLYQQLLSPQFVLEVSDELLIERVRQRHQQGRVATIYRFYRDAPELSPKEQIRHMENRTQIGLELIKAERKLLEEELSILREQ